MRDGMRVRREEQLAKLAARQHGAVSLGQAEEIGFARTDVFRRTQAGTLRRVFPRIYRVAGSPPSLEQRAIAACLWAGRDAVVSHDTAAALWGIDCVHSPLHVTVPGKGGKAPRGIRVHVSSIPRRERGRLRGIPVTCVARTLLDLAAEGPDDRLLEVVERAVLDGFVSAEQVLDVVERNRGRRGSRRLRRVLEAAGDSALERRVRALLDDAGLPPHEREHPVGAFRLDFAWPSRRVAIEADGRRWHSSAAGFERDRVKANALTERGWRVLRVTWRDLDDPRSVLAATKRFLELESG